MGARGSLAIIFGATKNATKMEAGLFVLPVLCPFRGATSETIAKFRKGGQKAVADGGSRGRRRRSDAAASPAEWDVTCCPDRRKSVLGAYGRNFLFRTFRTTSKRPTWGVRAMILDARYCVIAGEQEQS
jgi:hypothetical protein